MNPFHRYPQGGCVLLGRPRDNSNARHGQGRQLQQLTAQTPCAYCGVDLVADYYRWLLLSVDHVVLRGEANRLGIPPDYSEDFINLVVACAGCNGFGHRYVVQCMPKGDWSLDELLTLRDQVFADRFQQIADRRSQETAFLPTATVATGEQLRSPRASEPVARSADSLTDGPLDRIHQVVGTVEDGQSTESMVQLRISAAGG